jgi:hypothetical protein
MPKQAGTVTMCSGRCGFSDGAAVEEGVCEGGAIPLGALGHALCVRGHGCERRTEAADEAFLTSRLRIRAGLIEVFEICISVLN